jgi:hypothetical protein
VTAPCPYLPCPTLLIDSSFGCFKHPSSPYAEALCDENSVKGTKIYEALELSKYHQPVVQKKRIEILGIK